MAIAWIRLFSLAAGKEKAIMTANNSSNPFTRRLYHQSKNLESGWHHFLVRNVTRPAGFDAFISLASMMMVETGPESG
jgi:hypothetical protein